MVFVSTSEGEFNNDLLKQMLGSRINVRFQLK